MPRRARSGLALWLTASTTPLFVVDRRHTLLVFNAGCEALTGFAAPDLIGKRCTWTSHVDADSAEAVLSAIAPPEDAWSRLETSIAATVPVKSGESVDRTIRFVALQEADGAPQHLVGWILSPEERRSAPQPLDLHRQLAAARRQMVRRYGIETLLAGDAAMKRVVAQVQIAAPGNADLLLVGEPGTGREHVARMIHYSGPASGRPFVPLDVQETPPPQLRQTVARLIEAEEPAEGETATQRGTLFLRGICSLPADLQQQLVAASAADSPWRLMAAADRPLGEKEIGSTVLEELYYRVTQLTIELPPLRERGEEILLLAQWFLEESNARRDTPLNGFDNSLQGAMRRYSWPGNVGELKRIVEQMAETAAGPLVTMQDRPLSFRLGVDAQDLPPMFVDERPLQQRVDDFEREVIARTLEEVGGNKSKASDRLGIPRPRLYRRMEALGIRADEEGTSGE